MKKKKIIIITIFVFLTNTNFLFSKTLKFPRLNLNYDLNEEWKYYGLSKISKTKFVYTFKRKPIKDKIGEPIIPAIVFLFEKYNKDISPIQYSIAKRVQFNLKEIKLLKTYIDKITGIKSAVFLHGEKIDKKSKRHLSFILFSFTYGEHGITVICNSTSDVISKVTKEFIDLIKSMKITTNENIIEIVEMNHNGIIKIMDVKNNIGIVKSR